MRGALLITALAAVLLLGGCGGGSDGASSKAETVSELAPTKPPREMSVTLDGHAGPENLGILMADWEGYFEEAGLEVATLSPSSPRRPVMYTADESVDVGISREPEVALAQERGAPVIAIGSLVSEPTAAMIWLPKSQIDGIADLKGKVIGTAGLPVQEQLLGAILASAGLTLADVKLKEVDYDLVSGLAKGRVDAIFGANWNLDGIQLEEMGLDPVVRKVQDLGVPDYDEFVVIARRDRLEKEPQLFRDFMAAVARGTATAIEDPNLAFEVVNEDVESDYSVTPAARKAQVEATLPLLSESGQMDETQAESLVAWMHGKGLIQHGIPVSSLLTEQYLPEP